MAVVRRDYWRGDESESDSDSDDEPEETMKERITENGKRLYEFAAGWSKWTWKHSKDKTFELCAHTFFITLPFAIVIMQHTLEDQKWEHTLNVARDEIQKQTMIKMGEKMKNVSLPPIAQK
eukprot:UN07137